MGDERFAFALAKANEMILRIISSEERREHKRAAGCRRMWGQAGRKAGITGSSKTSVAPE